MASFLPPPTIADNDTLEVVNGIVGVREDGIGDREADAAIARQSDLAAEEAARIAADSAEATARGDADNTLQDNIDAEEVARIAGDDAILAQKGAVGGLASLDGLDGQVVERVRRLRLGAVAGGTDGGGVAVVGTEIQYADETNAALYTAARKDLLDAETAARIAADAALQTAIDGRAHGIHTQNPGVNTRTVDTGLSTVESFVANVQGTLADLLWVMIVGITGGSVDYLVVRHNGTVLTDEQSVHWQAVGT